MLAIRGIRNVRNVFALHRMCKPCVIYRSMLSHVAVEDEVLWDTSASFKWNPSTSWRDMFMLGSQLSAEELMLQETAQRIAQNELLPRVKRDYMEELPNTAALEAMGSVGLLGPTIYGASSTAYGLIAREIEKVDSGYRSMFSVQSSLVMEPIAMYGSEEQKTKYLSKLGEGTLVGCFAQTEPEAGSDVRSMRTFAKLKDGAYYLNGVKTWITNAPLANIALVWAKTTDEHSKTAEDLDIKCFIVEVNSPGVTVNLIKEKMGLRTSPTGEIVMEDVRVPKENVLPNTPDGVKAIYACLNSGRMGIAWGALGAAEACLDIAQHYALTRKQFGRPIAAKQLIQKKLADVVTEISLGLQGVFRASQMKDAGMLHPNVVSVLKRNNTMKALEIARTCRDILGANGISLENHVMRHMLNLEAVNTYEGTQDIHALIVGKAVTGISAF